jgi:hypothetical protein
VTTKSGGRQASDHGLHGRSKAASSMGGTAACIAISSSVFDSGTTKCLGAWRTRRLTPISS